MYRSDIEKKHGFQVHTPECALQTADGWFTTPTRIGKLRMDPFKIRRAQSLHSEGRIAYLKLYVQFLIPNFSSSRRRNNRQTRPRLRSMLGTKGRKNTLLKSSEPLLSKIARRTSDRSYLWVWGSISSKKASLSSSLETSSFCCMKRDPC